MEYLHREAGPRVVAKIRAKILDEVERMKQFPKGPQEKEYLTHLGLGHRRAVVGNY